MAEFNAKKARAKYALPMWVDAFVRKTLELSADEIGAYNLLLWAMWGRETCDLPDEDKKLARIVRSSTTTWRRRIRPTLEPFFEVERGVWSSKRLLEEAEKTERFLLAQHRRRAGGDKENDVLPSNLETENECKNTQNISDKSLKSNEPIETGDTTADITGEQPRERPFQETKSMTDADDARARDFAKHPPPAEATFRERILTAIGVDPITGFTGHGGVMLGRMADMAEANAWLCDLGLTDDEVIGVVSEVMAKRDGPPNSFKYYTPAMREFAGAKSAPKLTAIEGGAREPNRSAGRKPASGESRGASAHETLMSGFAWAVSKEP